MNIRIAEARDFTVISGHDRHISPAELENSIRLGRAAVAEEDGVLLGWLRWNLFWDNIPFLNLIYLLEPHRGKGHGKAMMDWWESPSWSEAEVPVPYQNLHWHSDEPSLSQLHLS